jgi:hypothetical protein
MYRITIDLYYFITITISMISVLYKVNDIVVLDKVTTPANWEYIEFELNNDILSFEVYTNMTYLK